MISVGENRYGKEGIRLVRVRRSSCNGNTLDEWTLRILVQGDFVSSYSEADNSQVLPTDTMKNTGKYNKVALILRIRRLFSKRKLTRKPPEVIPRF